MLPKARLAGFAIKSPCVTPVPESGMLKLEFEPLDVMLTLPLTAPLVVGENRTVNEVLWPAFSVKGNVSPLKLNPVPLAEAATEGAKTALNVVLCPALSVIGRLGPVKLNPLPVAAALDTVTAAPPVFVTATGTV